MEQKTEGTNRIIVGLNLLDRGVIRDNFKIFKDGVEIGYVTSGGYSPTLKKTIGLGLIKIFGCSLMVGTKQVSAQKTVCSAHFSERF